MGGTGGVPSASPLGPPPSAPLGGCHRASITGTEDKSRLDGRALDEAVGWVLGVRGQLRAVLGLGVETRTKAREGTGPALEQCGRVPAGMAMLLARVTGQGSRLSQVGSLAEGPPSLADQMPRKSQAEELEVSEARGAHGAQEWDLTGPGDRRW